MRSPESLDGDIVVTSHQDRAIERPPSTPPDGHLEVVEALLVVGCAGRAGRWQRRAQLHVVRHAQTQRQTLAGEVRAGLAGAAGRAVDPFESSGVKPQPASCEPARRKTGRRRGRLRVPSRSRQSETGVWLPLARFRRPRSRLEVPWSPEITRKRRPRRSSCRGAVNARQTAAACKDRFKRSGGTGSRAASGRRVQRSGCLLRVLGDSRSARRGGCRVVVGGLLPSLQSRPARIAGIKPHLIGSARLDIAGL